MDTIGDRLRMCRKEKGYSQEQLAERLFMQKSTICKYETNQHDIPAQVIVVLAKELDTTPNYLLLGETSDLLTATIERIKSDKLRELALLQIQCILRFDES